jgi:hypothetical protein
MLHLNLPEKKPPFCTIRKITELIKLLHRTTDIQFQMH